VVGYYVCSLLTESVACSNHDNRSQQAHGTDLHAVYRLLCLSLAIKESLKVSDVS
jgi:hypothetical protein